MKPPPSPLRSERGSLLIVAMILCAVIGIALASYLQLGRTSLAVSNRALYNNAAINLAENGLEEAMYAINQMVADDTYTWPSWSNNGTGSSSAAWRKWTGYTFDQNATGMVRVYVYNYKGVSPPRIVARSSITLGGISSAPIEKWIEVTLKKTSKFSNGLVAKNSIIFNGNNATVDSWDSDPDRNAGTAPVPYSAGVRKDNGSVGSISVAVNAVLVKQADIWGYVATGGSDPTTAVGTNGSILGAGSTYDPSTWTNHNVDPTRVSTDFAANFDPVTAPAKSYITDLGNINGTLTLPRGSDAPSADGNYYYEVGQINFNNAVLTIADKVVIKLTNTSTAIKIGGGSGEIAIKPTVGSLSIYADGDIDIAGKGVANGGTTDAAANQPVNFQLWGTKTSGTQDIKIAGNGVLSGVIYAPQANVAINGNGSVSGSVVANNITLVGNANFHYDESLSDFGGGNPYRVSKWRELTSATDRSTYAGVLGF
ncbi:MAG: hypothetical protein JNG83_04185 [Opitutaceae bacterium]|nr:hypothetical protein [Opitutaceae bacterium]